MNTLGSIFFLGILLVILAYTAGLAELSTKCCSMAAEPGPRAAVLGESETCSAEMRGSGTVTATPARVLERAGEAADVCEWVRELGVELALAGGFAAAGVDLPTSNGPRR